MKKQILILLVLPLLFSCGEKKKIKTDLTLSGINGKVKEIMWAEFNVKEAFGEIKKDSLISKYKLYYNVQGNQSSWNQYNTNKLIAKGITEFNEFNKCSEYTTYNGEGELTQKKKYIYDKNKNKIETNIYNEDGSLSSKYIYIDDNKGNKTEVAKYDENGELMEHYKNRYDIDNNRIETSSYDKDTTLTRIDKLNTNHTIIEQSIYNDNGNILETWKMKCDENGNRVEAIMYDENGDFVVRWTYSYEYDRQKNWTIMNAYPSDTVESLVYKLNKKIMKITEREITYY